MRDGKQLSAEMIAILAVGATLAGMILSGQARTESKFASLEARMSALEHRMGAFEQRLARIEGLVEGAALFAVRDGSDAANP